MTAPLLPPRPPLFALPGPRRIVPAAAVLALTILAVIAAPGWLALHLALPLLLMAVLLNAAAFGLITGMLSALAGFGLFNFFLVEPRYTLHAARPQDWVMLVAFLAAAALTGLLAGRLREERDAALGRAKMLEVLADSAETLGQARDEAAILTATLGQIARLAPQPLLALDPDTPAGPAAAIPPGYVPTAADLQAAAAALRRRQTEYGAEDGWNASPLTFHPLPCGAGGPRLAIGHGAARGGADYDQAIRAVLQLSGSALERSHLARLAEAERIARDREGLKTALLASLSHDLRTPLATILGAATTLRTLETALAPEARADLLAAIEEEAARLAGYVEKLLQMTRLMAGPQLNGVALDPADCAKAALRRALRAFPGADIATDLPELPLVRAEAQLLEQLIFNLLENALRYAPGPLQLCAAETPESVEISLTDQGPGLPDALRSWLASDAVMPGTPEPGLGLAIAKGIARAHGGQLLAQATTQGGTRFSLTLPRSDAPAATLPSPTGTEPDLAGTSPPSAAPRA